MSETTEKVQIRTASLHLGPNTGDWKNDTITLKMTTADKMEVEFELDAVSVALLALTIGPAMQGLKVRAEVQGEGL